ncbi:hypothetical protein P5673_033588 [Acropora cervicornis]|nr:hypothetical protein P5673_033588 [Acropora cervicornis]
MVHWLLCQCLSLDVNLTWSLMKLKNWSATPLQQEYLMIWGLEVTLICASSPRKALSISGHTMWQMTKESDKEDILTREEQQASLLYFHFHFKHPNQPYAISTIPTTPPLK